MMSTTLQEASGDAAFGTTKEWCTWSGPEIAQRASYYLRSKIDELKADGAKTPRNAFKMEQFFNPVAPPISLDEYVKRIVHYTRVAVSPVNIGVALMYIERIQQRELCRINENTIFRLFLTAFLVAFKRMDDPPVMKNKDYCKIAGVSLRELNEMELIFVKALEFDLGVCDDADNCKRITQVLVPTRQSTSSVIYGISAAEIVSVYRFTPDSVVADLESEEYTGSSSSSSSGWSGGENSSCRSSGDQLAGIEKRQHQPQSQDELISSGNSNEHQDPFESYWRQREASYNGMYGVIPDSRRGSEEAEDAPYSNNVYDAEGLYVDEGECVVEGKFSNHGGNEPWEIKTHNP